MRVRAIPARILLRMRINCRRLHVLRRVILLLLILLVLLVLLLLLLLPRGRLGCVLPRSVLRCCSRMVGLAASRPWRCVSLVLMRLPLLLRLLLRRRLLRLLPPVLRLRSLLLLRQWRGLRLLLLRRWRVPRLLLLRLMLLRLWLPCISWLRPRLMRIVRGWLGLGRLMLMLHGVLCMRKLRLVCSMLLRLPLRLGLPLSIVMPCRSRCPGSLSRSSCGL